MSPNQQSDFMVIQYYKLMEQLRSITSFLDAYETRFVTFLAESLSGKNNTVNDIKVIKRNFILLLNVLLSCCIVYNWYYLMFYVDETGNRIDSYKFSLETLQEKKPIIHVIFKYTLCVLSIVTSTLLDTIPSTLRRVSVDPKINKMIQFIFLFGFIISIVTVFGTSILDLVGSIEFIGFFCITFVLYGIYTFVMEFTDKDPFVITTRMKKYTAFGQMTPLLYLLLFFLRIIWSISTVFITSLSNFFYLILNSLFAIICYSQKPFITTINTIHNFIRKNDNNIKKDQTMFQQIINFFIENIYTFLFEFVLIITLTISLFDYSLQMNDTKKLQITMTSFCSTFIFLLCFIIYQRFTYIKKINTNTNTTNIQPISIPNIVTTNQLSSSLLPVDNISKQVSSLLPVDNISKQVSSLLPVDNISKQVSSLLPFSDTSSNKSSSSSSDSISSLMVNVPTSIKSQSISNTMLKSPKKALNKMLNILRKK